MNWNTEPSVGSKRDEQFLKPILILLMDSASKYCLLLKLKCVIITKMIMEQEMV